MCRTFFSANKNFFSIFQKIKKSKYCNELFFYGLIDAAYITFLAIDEFFKSNLNSYSIPKYWGYVRTQ